MKLHPPAHKHVGDAGKPGQIVNQITEPLNEAQVEQARQLSDPMYRHSCITAEDGSRGQAGIGHMLRDLMYQHDVSPFNQAQKQAKTPKDML